jgi:hypothetical protein
MILEDYGGAGSSPAPAAKPGAGWPRARPGFFYFVWRPECSACRRGAGLYSRVPVTLRSSRAAAPAVGRAGIWTSPYWRKTGRETRGEDVKHNSDCLIVTRYRNEEGYIPMNQRLTLPLALLVGMLGGLLSHFVAPALVRAQAPDAPTQVNALSFNLVDETGAIQGSFGTMDGKIFLSVPERSSGKFVLHHYDLVAALRSPN